MLCQSQHHNNNGVTKSFELVTKFAYKLVFLSSASFPSAPTRPFNMHNQFRCNIPSLMAEGSSSFAHDA